MEPISIYTGVAAPLLRINIDTDAIIPSREMKGVSKKGLGEGLFAAWRYNNPDLREPNPDFVLNQPGYRNCSILLGGDNFGCGSSREHAVWALAEYGIRVIISPSFGSIFYQNCIRNGLVPAILSNESILELADEVEANPQSNPITLDLKNLQIIATSGKSYTFELAPSHQEMLLKGLDAIGVTLTLEDRINAFEESYNQAHPWLLSSIAAAN